MKFRYEDDLFFLNDLQEMLEVSPFDTDDVNPSAAKFRAEKLEERVLFSATWFDADSGEELGQATNQDDLYIGSEQRDVARARDGNDVLYGRGGDDRLIGGSGNDILVGGAGNDELDGGAGDDTFRYQADDGIDRFRGGQGTDTIDVTGTDTLNANNITRSDSIEAIQGSASGTRITGTSGNDNLDFRDTTLQDISKIDSGGGNDYVVGWQGADHILAGSGNDRVYGQSGDDLIVGGQGNDRLYGNDGDDTFLHFQGDGIDQFQGGKGLDTIDASQADELGLQQFRVKQSIELIQGSETGTRIEGTDGRNHLDFSNTVLENISEIDGGAGNDDLRGSQGDDVIRGGTGNDRLYGEAGDDVFEVREGDGLDRFVGGQGQDSIDATQAETLALQRLARADSIESIVGSDSGTQIKGTSGRNTLDFRNTHLENITAIDAAAGNDQVHGSEAADIIVGGQGNDQLYGHAGNDTFVYREGDGLDRFDGGDGDDRIDATAADALHIQRLSRGELIESIDGNLSGTKIVGSSGRNTFDFRDTTLNNITAIDAGAGRDQIQGSQGNDLLIASAGNDRFYGHDGEDAVQFSGNHSEYQIRKLSGGRISVEDLRDDSPDGRDTISGIELLKFADGQVAVNEAFVFTHQSLLLSGGCVNENSEAGTLVGTLGRQPEGYSYVFVDADGNHIADSNFEIIGHEIRVKAGAELDFEMENSFAFRVQSTDTLGNLFASTIRINVTDVEESPIAQPDQLSTLEDQPLIFNSSELVWNDRDGDGDAIVVSSVYGARHGLVGLNHDGTITFTPDENFEGQAGFTYVAETPDGQQTTAQVSVLVAAVNDPVTGIQLSGTAVEENSPAGTLVGTLNPVDVDAVDMHSYQLVDNNGNSVIDNRFEIVDDTIVVRDGAELNYENSPLQSLNIRVTDSAGHSHSETFTIHITNVNEGQIGQGESFELNEDGFVSGNLLTNDMDIDGDHLYVSQFSQPTHGTVIVEANGEFLYEPVGDFSGSDAFTYQIADGHGETTELTVTLHVSAVADPARLIARDVVGDEDTAIELNIEAALSDNDGSERLTAVRILGVPDGAQLSAGVNNGDGTWSLHPDDLPGLTVTPAENSHCDFDLTIEVTSVDGDDTASVGQTMQVTVNPVNDPVTGIRLSQATVPENSLGGTVVGVLEAIDDDALENHAYQIVDQDGNPTRDAHFEIAQDLLIVRDDAKLNFEDSRWHALSIRATDSAGHVHDQMINIHVSDVNDSPTVTGKISRPKKMAWSPGICC